MCACFQKRTICFEIKRTICFGDYKNRIFFNYLYSHYFVSDVILIDGHSLYSKQGTSFDVRLILINGRKAKPKGVAPLKNEQLSEVVYDFDRLYSRVMNEQTIEKFEDDDFIKLLSSKVRMLKIKYST